MLKRILTVLILLTVAGIGVWGVRRYFAKRAGTSSAATPAPSKGPGISPEKTTETEKLQKKRLEETIKTLEETRRINEMTLPKNVLPVRPPVADIQRTFNTLEEINRLNRLNRETRERQQAVTPRR